jgi:hypothetical protein
MAWRRQALEAVLAVTLVLALGCALIAVSNSAHATIDCVSYQVKGPLVGNRQGTACSPINDPFDHPFVTGQCQTQPDLGLQICTTASIHEPG